MRFLITDAEIQHIKDAAVENYKAGQYDSVEEAKREDCTLGFDFNHSTMKVFSVERIWGSASEERTVVGYQLLNNDNAEIKEWTLLCSRRQHNRLVELLLNKKASTPTKKTLLKG